MPWILPICVVTYQLKPGSASLLAFVSTPITFVSQAGKIRKAGLHIYPALPNSGLTIDTSQVSSQAAAHRIYEFLLEQR